MCNLTSLPTELTLIILENVLCNAEDYNKDLLHNKRHACHHHDLSHPLATPVINAAACKISLTSRRMRDESKGIVEIFKKCLKRDFEEWRDAWILGERECECLCEDGCFYCELPGLLDMDRLEDLERLREELGRWKKLRPVDGVEKARLVNSFVKFWDR